MSEKLSCPACKHALPTGQVLGACPYCGRKLKLKKAPVATAPPPPASTEKQARPAPPPVEEPAPLVGYGEDEYIAPLPVTRARRSIDKRLVLMIAGGTLLLAIVVTVAYFLTLLQGGETPAPIGTMTQRRTASLPAASVGPQAPPPPVEPATSVPTDVPTVRTRRITPRYASLVASPPGENKTVESVSEREITAAMQRGVDFLLSDYKGSLLDSSNINKPFYDGLNCLSAQALIHAGKALGDKRLAVQEAFMSGVLDELKKLKMDTHYAVYSRSLRMSALALAGRPRDRAQIADDLKWMLEAAVEGGFNYGSSGGAADNSNSQYGALAYWAAAEAGIAVPPEAWAQVRQYWSNLQFLTGGWTYRGKAGTETAAMTAAGVTTLALAELLPAAGTLSKPITLSDPVQRGITWLGEGDRMIRGMGEHSGYTLYGIERAGLATGYRYFGDKDWFLTLAPHALAQQKEDGSWTGADTVIGETAFHLLFLSRGSHPILMSKLQFDGKWRNRPNDVAHLAGWAGPMLERAFNWQIVPITQPWQNWTGSPVVYLASDEAPKIGDHGLAQLAGFATHGGTLFTHADKSSKAFNDWIEANVAKIFPGLSMVDVPADHPIYTVAAKLQRRPPLRMVTNGSRVLLFHSPTDVAGLWDPRHEKSNPDGLGLGINVAVYATGLNPFRTRLQAIYEAEQRPASGLFPIARVSHNAQWNVEPAAWDNFGRWLQTETGLGIKEEPVEAAKLDFFEQPIAHLTGSGKYVPSTDTVTALARYVSSGGVLLIDATGGNAVFAESARALIDQMLAIDPASSGQPRRVGLQEPLVTPVSWPATPAVEVRPSVGGRPENVDPAPEVLPLGRGFILYTDRDLTTGLMGANVWNMHGYTVNWSRAMVKNLILATIDRGKRIAMDVPVN
jgi:hypothetical protein